MVEVLRIPYEPQKWQAEFHKSNARFRTMACGRRCGKTVAGAIEGIRYAIERPKSIVWVVAPIYSQVMIFWRKLLEYLPPNLIKETNQSDRRITLINDSDIWFKSAENFEGLRGEGLDLVIIDEASKVKRDAWEYALRPALSDKKGRGVFISTPAGMNWFYETYANGIIGSGKKDEYESWKLPTSENKYIDKSEIEAAKRMLPELVFKQEFLAEFLENIGSVFRKISENIKGTFEEAIPNRTYIMGVDLAKHEDFTVISILDTESNHLVYFDRFNEIAWDFQKQRIIECAKRYNGCKIIIDSTGVGDPIVSDLEKEDLNIQGFKFTYESKGNLIQNLSIKIEQGKINYPEIPVLIEELRIFGYEITEQTRRVLYSAPHGYHDDCVISLALAAWGLLEENREVSAFYETDSFDYRRGIETDTKRENVLDDEDDESEIIYCGCGNAFDMETNTCSNCGAKLERTSHPFVE